MDTEIPKFFKLNFQDWSQICFFMKVKTVFTHEELLIHMNRIHFLPLCCTQQMSHESSQQVSLEYQAAEFLNKKLKQSTKSKY